MTYSIAIQNISLAPTAINEALLENWARLALQQKTKEAVLTIRLVDEAEITALNKQYRGKDKATNVLAFPSALPQEIFKNFPFVGDVVICPKILEKESKQLEKALLAHWALIVIHGVLHLLGYDHIEEQDTIQMQSLEILLLENLGYPNPYQEEE